MKAPPKSKPTPQGATSIPDWASDQTLSKSGEMSSEEYGQQTDTTNPNIHVQNTCYVISNHTIQGRGSLVDRGANGGIAGSDTRVIFRHLRKVDVTGIDNHEMTDLSIVDAAGWDMSNEGPVNLILRQYAYHGMGRTIHSALQLEQYKIKVDDRSIKAGGRQLSLIHI